MADILGMGSEELIFFFFKDDLVLQECSHLKSTYDRWGKNASFFHNEVSAMVPYDPHNTCQKLS